MYQWPPRSPNFRYQSNSSLTDEKVLSEQQVRTLACSLDAIQTHFSNILNADNSKRWFTMEVEFKYLQSTDELLIKQARPYQFNQLNIKNDCREF